MPELGDERPEDKANGDEGDRNCHHRSDAKFVGPVSDDGCEDAGDEGERERQVQLGLVPAVTFLQRPGELAEGVLRHADREAGREEYEEGSDVAAVDAECGADGSRGEGREIQRGVACSLEKSRPLRICDYCQRCP